MPDVETFSVGTYSTNCYVVRAGRDAAEAVVVDPGASGAELRFELGRLRTRCAAILVTHGHHDHIGGVADLAEGTGAKVYMPAGEEDRLERFAEFALGNPGRPYTPDHLLVDGETIVAACLEIECISVPGHTPAHLAFHVDGCLFTGDTLFAGAIGNADFEGGDWTTLVQSIRTLFERYPGETAVYPGHGAATTLGAELARARSSRSRSSELL